jgi:hypothetical protein
VPGDGGRLFEVFRQFAAQVEEDVGERWLAGEVKASPPDLIEQGIGAQRGGIGNGLAFSTMIASGTTAVPMPQSSAATGVINTGRQVASAIGVAILVALLGAGEISAGDATVTEGSGIR